MREHSSIRLAIGVFALLLLAIPLGFTGGVAAGSPAAGIIVPLYTYPGSTWDEVAQTKMAHDNVPIVAIVNPASGPGSSKDANYESGITKLQSAGVTVIGYVSTAYTSRDLANVKADIDRWKSWYPSLDGIFFDEQTNVAGKEWYYSDANGYAKSKGLSFTVGNPGANSIQSYLDTVDVVLIYESPGLPNLASYQSWSSADNTKLGMIPFGVGPLPKDWINGAVGIVGWIYVTDDVLPNPWDSLPSYFEGLAQSLDGDTTSPPPTSTPHHTMTVKSVDQEGVALDGMWIQVNQGSEVVSSGFTPLTLSLEQSTYTVSASDYQQLTFDHWSDGTESSTTTVNLSSDTSMTANYVDGSLQAAFLAELSADTTTATAGATVTFQATSSGGSSPYMWSVDFGDGTSSPFGSATFLAKQYNLAGTYNAVATAMDSRGVTTASSPVEISIGQGSINLAVTTANSAGPMSGYYVTLEGDAQVEKGFSPASFSLAAGQTYTVAVSDYGNYVFSQWEDGSTSRARIVSISKPTTLTAFYSEISQRASLAVKTVGPDGSPIVGMWTVIRSPDGTTEAGFSPVSFNGDKGEKYRVTVADYGRYTFDHWENGSTQRTRALELHKDRAITAYYR